MGGDSLARLAQTALEMAVSGGIRKVMRVRTAMAFDTLLDEWRAGNLSPNDVAERDDIAAMMLQYFTTMSLGAAATNLRILARILVHKSERPDRSADEFVMWANIVGGLQPEELLFLAVLADCWKDRPPDYDERDDVGMDFMKAITGTSGELKESSDVQMVGHRLIATGLVQPIRTIGGGNRFKPTRRLWRLVDMARLSEFGPAYRGGEEAR